ncbi:MAG: tRNA-modifying protein YgfZ, partial [Pseudonocardiales bacterium]|nr:tRNA-modifying protein YgfZ [Pseudonocardiales bacterium]
MTTELAVPATGRDSGVAWHYGDPLREQRVLTTGAGVVDRSNRDVLAVPGADRLGWLHSICSQHVSALTDGDATEALVLSPHGHVEQHWQMTELDGTVWIDTEPGAAPMALEYLHKMQFLKRVEPADVSPAWAVLSVVGPATQAV